MYKVQIRRVYSQYDDDEDYENAAADGDDDDDIDFSIVWHCRWRMMMAR